MLLREGDEKVSYGTKYNLVVRKMRGEAMDAYLDIETSYRNEITILGVYRKDTRLHQLIDKNITPNNVLGILKDIDVIYTYNGSRFDLPVITRQLGLDLSSRFRSHDLMYDCWKKNLYGGLKWVERVLSIKRTLDNMDGRQAMELWERYFWFKDNIALKKLLKYNEEDVVNLTILKEKLIEL